MTVSWTITGPHLKNCNCAFGCPCDFNAPPTQGPCEGMVGMRIDEGYFGDTRLDGLCWGAAYHWPGPLHEGNGTMQSAVDERADEAQRNAILTILSGREQAEGTFFHIISTITPNILTPVFVAIDFAFNLESRSARMSVPGVFETTSEPIRNPVTGEPHRIRVDMPEGFEYKIAEIACATVKGTGEIAFDHGGCHSSMAMVELNEHGLAA